ncbi:hypothetical protein A0J48_025500 [Sphaerospermopsis aphanizomenoides BCCUSP55]|uniref:hypothetical protein n=1 Tax=Sphaerospermopsis aphanizomenoides TaxID=459663 RepID=UPI001904B086|nr:hypothetical protein [Sphaerospermopsis aphanizomenoides]MBK1990823.1 hypothetical protein [Sphaerospermopsis aphanizomenoides BCCUSP55]
MSNNQNSESKQFADKLQVINAAVKDAAQVCQGDTIALLALLRQLENLHREIRDGIFQESLPDNRQRLYSLLKDIESEGGWPYIERMRLQAFLVNLPAEVGEEKPIIKNTNDSLDSDNWLEW